MSPSWQALLALTLARAAMGFQYQSVAAVAPLMTEGLGNAQIAERLSISEKTVRNHVSNLFDKLGVWTRAQAIVFARDRGFRDKWPAEKISP